MAVALDDMGLLLDIDGNSKVDPPTDCLLIYRFMRGLDLNARYDNLVEEVATRDETAMKMQLQLQAP